MLDDKRTNTVTDDDWSEGDELRFDIDDNTTHYLSYCLIATELNSGSSLGIHHLIFHCIDTSDGDVQEYDETNHKWIPTASEKHSHSNKSVLDLISDAGSFNIITTIERNAITHSNRAVLDLISDAGSYKIITNDERFLTHRTFNKLKLLSDVSLRLSYPTTLSTTSNTWDGNTSYGSSIFSTSFEAYYAFDGSDLTRWASLSRYNGSYTGPTYITTNLGVIHGEYLSITLSGSITAGGYVIKELASGTNLPKNWVFLVYNHSSTEWEVIDDHREIDTITWENTDTIFELTFNIRDNDVSSTIYAILITEVQSSGTTVGIAELKLLSKNTKMTSNSILQYNNSNSLWEPIVSTTFSLSTHDHDTIYEPIITKNTAFNKSFGTGSGTVAEGNHTHSIFETIEDDIEDLTNELNSHKKQINSTS